MSFFQNPFSSDFRGNLVLGDRAMSLTFECPRNTGRGDDSVTAWEEGNYDFSGNDADGNSKNRLYFKFAIDGNLRNWATFYVDVSGDNPSATTPQEVVTALNDDNTFSSYFTASLMKFHSGAARLVITQKFPVTRMKFFVVNGRAESVIKFNARAGIAELPTYFSRHTVGNSANFNTCDEILIELDPDSSDVDADLIDNAVDAKGVSRGLNSGTIKEDWQLLKGRSGIFQFQNITVDGDDRITQIIEYAAGSVVGDMSRKIIYVYTDDNQKPSQIFEIPYTLEEGDLIEP